MTQDRREAYARIIDPVAFDNTGDLARTRRTKARVKANAILASDAGGAVKPLEWDEQDDSDGRYVWRSYTSTGQVYSVADDGFSTPPFTLSLHQLVIGSFETADAAKSAAQFDYEQRIRSALVAASQPAPGWNEAIEAAIDKLCDIEVRGGVCRWSDIADAMRALRALKRDTAPTVPTLPDREAIALTIIDKAKETPCGEKRKDNEK